MLAQKIDSTILELMKKIAQENKKKNTEEYNEEGLLNYKKTSDVMRLIKAAFIEYCTSEEHMKEFTPGDSTEKRITQISDDTELKILNKMANQRKESIDCAEKAVKQAAEEDKQKYRNIIDKETFELNILKQYLPEDATPEMLVAAINEIINSGTEATKKNMRVFMDTIKAKYPTVDGKELAKLVSSYLH